YRTDDGEIDVEIDRMRELFGGMARRPDEHIGGPSLGVQKRRSGPMNAREAAASRLVHRSVQQHASAVTRRQRQQLFGERIPSRRRPTFFAQLNETQPPREGMLGA